MMTPDTMQISQILDNRRAALAEATLECYNALYPNAGGSSNERVYAISIHDIQSHLIYLSEAIAGGCPGLFVDYVAWVKLTWTARGLPLANIASSFEALLQSVDQLVPTEARPVIRNCIQAGLRPFAHLPTSVESLISDDNPLSGLAHAYLEALLRGDRQAASQMILNAVASQHSVQDIYLQVFQPVQREIGRLWQLNQVSVAQEHYCTAATQLIMSQLYPYIFSSQKNGRTLVATCVGGELHEIGMRMVADFFEIAQWDTFYLGANMPAESIVQTLIERRAQVLGISATMTYHVRLVQDLIAAVRTQPECASITILVGGYPFNLDPSLWRTVGADGCARDAAGAIAVAERLITVLP